MKIKTRLAVQFTLIVTILLIIFSVFIYAFWFVSQQAKFRDNLLRRARNTGTLFFNMPDIDSAEFRNIHRSTLSWRNEEIVIVDSSLEILYSNRAGYLTENTVRNYSGPDEVQYFSIKEKDGVRFNQVNNNSRYYIYVMAFDRDRYNNLKELFRILRWGILAGIAASVSLSYFFAYRAILPLSVLIRNVKSIDFDKLSSRLDEGKNKDEIGQLASNINEMLERIEISFRNQEEFVTNASHELRTPLTILISEADYLLRHNHKKEDYIEHILRMIEDLKGLNDLSNSLLELSRLKRDNRISLAQVKVDEILFKVVQNIKKKYPDRKIISKINYSEDYGDMVVLCNSGLIELALRNVLDNACKFSDDEVMAEIHSSPKDISIIITDKGVGIPKSEMDIILSPFSRASNVKSKSGFGIGLAIVARIAELHAAEIKVESEVNKGTRFEILLRKEG